MADADAKLVASPAFTIITGAQTGVDTAAIKAAIKLQIPYRGWVPQGFTNEAGPIPDEYRSHFQQTPSPETSQRTEWNMLDADSVLTLLRGLPDSAKGGTKWGVQVSRETSKNMCFVDLRNDWIEEINKVKTWLKKDKVENVAIGGPRESEEPGIEGEAEKFLSEALEEAATMVNHPKTTG